MLHMSIIANYNFMVWPAFSIECIRPFSHSIPRLYSSFCRAFWWTSQLVAYLVRGDYFDFFIGRTYQNFDGHTRDIATFWEPLSITITFFYVRCICSQFMCNSKQLSTISILVQIGYPLLRAEGWIYPCFTSTSSEEMPFTLCLDIDTIVVFCY